MANNSNPYQALGSMTGPGALTYADVEQRWLKAMRSTSNFALGTGLALAAGALAAPPILEWQAANTLRQFGAEHYLGTVIDAHIAPLQPGLTALALLAALVIAAGGGIRRLHQSALYVLIAVLALLIANAVLGLFSGPDSARVFGAARGIWLLFVCHKAWQTSRLTTPEARHHNKA